MVNPRKVYYMTRAAMYEKKEAHGELRIVNYKRRDYVLSRTLLSVLGVSLGYAALVGIILFIVTMQNETIVLTVSEMILIGLAILAGYAGVLAFYIVLSHKKYGEKHLKARKNVKKYLTILKLIDGMNEEKKGKESV